MASLEEKITDIIEEPIKAMGFGIVRLQFLSRSNSVVKMLEILIERLDEKHISIKDCTNVSRHISALLDVEDIIDGRYNLEVSSAGVERPLVKPQDFEKYKGYVVAIKLNEKVENLKKYQGILEEMTPDQIVKLKLENNSILNFEYSNIKDAKLVLTDELYKKIVKSNKNNIVGE